MTLAPGEGLRAGGKVLTLTLARENDRRVGVLTLALAPAWLTRPPSGGTPCLASGDG